MNGMNSVYNRANVGVGISYEDLNWKDIEGQPFGVANQLNAIIFSDANNIVDSEGAIAIGGSFTSPRGLEVAYGGEEKLSTMGVPPDITRFIVGKNVSIGGPLVVSGHVIGNASFHVGHGSTYFIGKEGSQNQIKELEYLYHQNGGSKYWKPSDKGKYYLISSYDVPRFIPADRIGAQINRFFENGRNSIIRQKQAMEQLQTNGKVLDNFHEWILRGNDPTQNVFTLDLRRNGIINKGIRAEVPAGSLVIVLIKTGANAHLQYGLMGTKEQAKNTIYVFEDATNIFMEVPADIWGSILAPQAMFHAHATGGHVSGNVALRAFAVNANSGFEFHWYPFQGGVQYPIVTVMPQAPIMPQAPTMPQVPAMPEAPTMPEVPAMPEAPTMPQVPAMPQAPTIPQAPTMPQAPTVPQAPTMPQAPTVPEVPRTSVAPSIPEIPVMPNVPVKPERTVVPAIPNPVQQVSPAIPTPQPCQPCPTCPTPRPCPETAPCPTCSTLRPCPEAAPCPTCPTPRPCPEAAPCPTCPTPKPCPEAAPCPTCPTPTPRPCPEAAPCPTCPIPKPCPTCPPQKPCPTCPEQKACPIYREQIIDTRVIMYPVKEPCPDCPTCQIAPGKISGCIWGCSCNNPHEWEVKLFNTCNGRITLIYCTKLAYRDCFEFTVPFEGCYVLCVCPINSRKSKICKSCQPCPCKPSVTFKNIGVSNFRLE